MDASNSLETAPVFLPTAPRYAPVRKRPGAETAMLGSGFLAATDERKGSGLGGWGV